MAIVGCGRAGGSIGLALARAGYTISAAWSRSASGRSRAAALLGAPVVDDPADVRADVMILSVPDDAIVAVASAVRPASGSIVTHTSGATSIGVLRVTGARVGCLHPLQTLADPERGADALRGAAVAVTCDEPERPTLESMARDWGGLPFRLADDAKPLYHAAAVFGSNYVVSALWAASALMERAGVPDAHVALGPLARAAVDNVVTLGPRRAITGPVVRGDVGVLRGHLAAIEDGPVRDAYRAMARLTGSLAHVDEDALAEALGA